MTKVLINKPFLHYSFFLPLVSALILYFIAQFVNKNFFAIAYSISIVDVILLILLSYFIYFLSKRFWGFLIVETIVIGIFYVSNAMKIAFLGGPVLPSDFYTFYALALVLTGIHKFYLLTPFILLAILLIYNIKINKISLFYSFTFLVSILITTQYSPQYLVEFVDKNYEYQGWNHRHNWETMGAVLFLTQAFARNKLEVSPPPSKNEVKIAVQALDIKRNIQIDSNKSFETPNIYLYLIESLWDVNLLSKAGFDRDPLDSRFRQLWEASGKSTVMSPVFANTTANAEFELLCGQDVRYAKGVVFEHALLNNVPCLPNVLANLGYKTYVAHPNIPDFFNRLSTYRRIGFQEMYFQEDLIMDDMNGPFLSDRSLFNQVLDKITPQISSQKPVFTYILTYTGHWAYPLNPEIRPHVLQTSSKIDDVINYANSIYYTTSEVYDAIEKTRQNDPSAIIIVLGDHLPLLGANYAGYVESELVDDLTRTSEETLKNSRSTPLIIINGNHGVINMGSVAMFEIPKIILNLMNYTQFSPLDLFQMQNGIRVRSIYETTHLAIRKDGEIAYCRPDNVNPICEKTRQWLQNTRMISNDLMRGKQHILELFNYDINYE